MISNIKKFTGNSNAIEIYTNNLIKKKSLNSHLGVKKCSINKFGGGSALNGFKEAGFNTE